MSEVDVNALKNVDLTIVEELFKLKGSTLDEPLIRLLLKSFTKKQEMLIQLERLQSENAIAMKQEAIE